MAATTATSKEPTMKKLCSSPIVALRATPLAASVLASVEGGASKADKEQLHDWVDALERALDLPKKTGANVDGKNHTQPTTRLAKTA
jgi:hypothetical protein